MAEEIAVKEKYMKEALRQAKKAAEAGDVPIRTRSLPEATIKETSRKQHWVMQRSQRYERRVKSWETGVWRNVPCMSRWSHALCVQELLYRRGFRRL